MIDGGHCARQGDRHADASGDDRGEDRRGQARLLARVRRRVGSSETNPLTEGSLGGRDFVLHAQIRSLTQHRGGQSDHGEPDWVSINLAATGYWTTSSTSTLQLQAAEVNGDGKVISSPRIVTLDNSEASIEQGVSIPFQTFENGDAQLEFVDAVLKLKVTPHITSDRSIIMVIRSEAATRPTTASSR